jgi:hypothetical protein
MERLDCSDLNSNISLPQYTAPLPNYSSDEVIASKLYTLALDEEASSLKASQNFDISYEEELNSKKGTVFQ